VACDFAVEAAAKAFPGLDVAHVTLGVLSSTEPVGLLRDQPRLNELTPEALSGLRALWPG